MKNLDVTKKENQKNNNSGNSTNNNSFINKINQNNKKNNAYKSQIQLKTLYNFIKGVPPSSNWSNHFTSTLFSNGKYLLYISNSFIIVLNLEKKNFSQILSSNKINQKDKPNILIELNNEKLLTITNNGEIIIFYLNNENNFIEDLSTNKLSKLTKKIKCGVYNRELKILILSNEDRIYLYSLQYKNGLNIYKIYEIDNINNGEYIITDMLIYNYNDINNYLIVSNNIGNIILYSYDIIKYSQVLVINNKNENIFNICYDNINNLLCSIDKSGTLNIYKINFNSNNDDKIEYNNIISLSHKFNDQSINEFYLYFSISFIYNNDKENKNTNNNYILVTSNQGRIFIYDIQKNIFKEIAENPHKNSIYTIILNRAINQVLFFSSDYKISLFNILFSKDFEPSLNYMYAINTIPSKVKLLQQYNNKVYFLYQIQHNLYINSYDIKKDKNYLDTLQNKIKLFSNKSKKNINNNNNGNNNYNIDLCKLIDEEKILLVNRNNEIIIYNFETDIKENNFLFLDYDNIILDILINENILYILYKEGLIITYNISSKNIEKYKISNSIDKGSLIYIRNGFIIIIIAEKKQNTIKFLLLKKYFFLQLNNININININNTNYFISQKIILSDDNFYYFYSNNNDLNILYMNISNQIKILENNNISYNDINYKEYLKITDDFNQSLKYINKKNYIFNEIFLRNDVNKNNFKMTDIAFNELNNNMICSFSDGSVMFYIININKKDKYNYTIDKIIYKYLIKAHYLSIFNSIFINKNDDTEKDITNIFGSTSMEQSIKFIDVSNCNILNLYFEPKKLIDIETNNNINNINIINNNNINSNLNYVINKSFTNLFSNYFFTQSYKDAKNFTEIFNLSENLDNCSIEQLIFSYYIDNKEKNLMNVKKIIDYCIDKIKNKKQYSLYIEKICNYFMNIENKKNSEYNIIFEVEKNKDNIIENLVNGFCYVECLLYIKYMNLGLNEFIICLEKIKKSIYTKQLYQVTKIEKIIQYYKNNFNINNK